MPVSYTNRKGTTYTLYKGETKTGKPRYYFGRSDQGQDELVEELPHGYTISESVNGIVSLVKERPVSIYPEEVAVVERAIKRHPGAKRYRIAVKGKRREIYERLGSDYNAVLKKIFPSELFTPDRVEWLQYFEERNAQFSPVLRFTLINPAQREFGVERMCYRSDVDDWLELMRSGTVSKLASELVPTLGTDDFFELW